MKNSEVKQAALVAIAELGFPHVAARVTALWGSPELGEYFDEIMHDHRRGGRQGFAPAAFSQLLVLFGLYKLNEDELSRRDPWLTTNAK